ncbi:MAG: hypothetical protein U0Y10_13590 [Spirosomataceae bacterium]
MKKLINIGLVLVVAICMSSCFVGYRGGYGYRDYGYRPYGGYGYAPRVYVPAPRVYVNPPRYRYGYGGHHNGNRNYGRRR